MTDFPEYGVQSRSWAEDHSWDVYSINLEESSDQKKIVLTHMATFYNEQAAYDFCDVWRGKALASDQ